MLTTDGGGQPGKPRQHPQSSPARRRRRGAGAPAARPTLINALMALGRGRSWRRPQGRVTRDDIGDDEPMSTTQLEATVEEIDEIDGDGFVVFDSSVFGRGSPRE